MLSPLRELKGLRLKDNMQEGGEHDLLRKGRASAELAGVHFDIGEIILI